MVMGVLNAAKGKPSGEVDSSLLRQANDQNKTRPKVVRSIWNPQSCIEVIEECKETKNYPLLKSIRMLVQVSTLDALLGNRYHLQNGENIKLDKSRLVQAIKRTKKYEYNERELKAKIIETDDASDCVTQYFVIPDDCLDVAYLARKKFGKRTCVLNMASASNPGGGWRNGAGAQEESLCRRTALPFCLMDPYQLVYQNREHVLYPMKEYSCIHSKNVPCFRASEGKGYEFLDKPHYLSFISAAAYRQPPIEVDSDGNDTLSHKWRIKWRNKVRMILRCAIDEGEKVLILSAWGTGVYGNPPHEVAKAFHDVLHEDEFKPAFEAVLFAIIEDHHSASRGYTNLSVFEQYFPIGTLE